MDSKTITLEFEVEVFYEVVRSIEGSDADDRRGMVSVECVPRAVEVLNKVPEEVRAYLKTCAIDQFNEKYNS